MLKKLMAILSVFITLLYTTVSSFGLSGNTEVNKVGISDLRGKVKISASNSPMGEAENWQIEYSVDNPREDGLHSIEINLLKNPGVITGSGYLNDDNNVNLNTLYTETFESGKRNGTLDISRQDLKLADGTGLVGSFTVTLSEVTVKDRIILDYAALEVEPKKSAYKGGHDFSGVVGTNFNNSSAVSQLHMWMMFDKFKEEIDRELGLAESFGLNTIRVFLHNIPYDQDKNKFLADVEEFLKMADRHKLKTLFVFFDDCHQKDRDIALDFTPAYGQGPIRWANCPFPDERKLENYAKFRGYIQDVIIPHKEDSRVFGWEIWNEPWYAVQNTVLENRNVGTVTTDLLKNAFNWAREAMPVQPVMNVWNGKIYSDVDERHTYGTIGTTSHNPEYDFTEPVGSNTIYTEAGNRYWGAGDNSNGTAIEYIHWLKERKKEGLPVPGVFLGWELMVGNVMVTIGSTPDGIGEPPIAPAGLYYKDGTPVSYAEREAVRSYVTGITKNLLFADFEDGRMDGWKIINGGWNIVRHPMETIPWELQPITDLKASEGAGEKTVVAGEPRWKDYFMEGTVKFTDGGEQGAGFLVRANDRGEGYYISFTARDLYLYKITSKGRSLLREVTIEGRKVWPGWRNMLRVIVKENNIKIYLNPFAFPSSAADPFKPSGSDPKKPVVDYTDNDSPILSGFVGLKAGEAGAQFDDVVVLPLDDIYLLEEVDRNNTGEKSTRGILRSAISYSLLAVAILAISALVLIPGLRNFTYRNKGAK